MPGAFAHAPNVRWLSLSGNTIPVLENHTFTGLSGLVNLVVESSNVESVDVLAFDGCSNMVVLYMAFNSIRHIARDAFTPCTALQYLHLHDNLLTEQPSGLLPRNLQVLELGQNRITALDMYVLSWHILPSLSTLDVSSNDLRSARTNHISLAASIVDLSHNPHLEADAVDMLLTFEYAMSVDLSGTNVSGSIADVRLFDQASYALRFLDLSGTPGTTGPLPAHVGNVVVLNVQGTGMRGRQLPSYLATSLTHILTPGGEAFCRPTVAASGDNSLTVLVDDAYDHYARCGCTAGHQLRPGASRAIDCEPCPHGQWSDDNMTTCHKCAVGAFLRRNVCVFCASGQFSGPESGDVSSCIDCPTEGVQCTPGVMEVEAGYWWPGAMNIPPASLYQCLDPRSCVPPEPIVVESPSLAAAVANLTARCREGGSGPLCAICEDGWARSEPGICTRCLPHAASLAIAVLLLLVMTVLVLWCVLGNRPALLDEPGSASWSELSSGSGGGSLTASLLPMGREAVATSASAATTTDPAKARGPGVLRTLSHLQLKPRRASMGTVQDEPGVLGGVSASGSADDVTERPGPVTRDEEPGVFITMLGHVQNVTLLAAYRTRTPALLAPIYSATHLIGNNVSALFGTPLACAFKTWTYVNTVVATALVPPVALAICVIFIVWRRWKDSAAMRRVRLSFVEELQHAGVALLLLVWPSLIFTPLTALVVHSEPVEGVWYLRRDFNVVADGAAYEQLVALAGSMLLVYGALAPLSVYRGIAAMRARDMPRATAVYGMLFDVYRPSLWWWKTTQLGRMALYAATTALLADGRSQIIVGALITIPSLVAHLSLRPHTLPETVAAAEAAEGQGAGLVLRGRLDVVETMSLTTLTLMLIGGVMFVDDDGVADTGAGGSALQDAVALVLAVANIGTLGYMLWLYFGDMACCRRACRRRCCCGEALCRHAHAGTAAHARSSQPKPAPSRAPAAGAGSPHARASTAD